MDLQKTIIGAAIAFIAIGIILFVLYQEQEALPLEEDYEPDLGPIPGVELGTGSGHEAPVIGNCPNLETQYDKDLCWSFQAGHEKDAELCNNIEGTSRKVICINAVARELLDTEICAQGFPENQDRFYACLTQIARDALDYAACDSMPSPYKEKCVRAVEDEEGIFPIA